MGTWGTACPTSWAEDPDGDAPHGGVPCTGNRRCSLDDGDFVDGCAPYWSLSCNGSYWESEYAHCDGPGPYELPENGPCAVGEYCSSDGETCTRVFEDPENPECQLTQQLPCVTNRWRANLTPVKAHQSDPDCSAPPVCEAGTCSVDAGDARDAGDAAADASDATAF
jgi:hypothetical protein